MHNTILLAVDPSTLDLTADDRLLADALEHRGANVRPLVWGDPLPLPRGAVVVVRSTWDYVESPERFTVWLDMLDDQHAVVYNPTSMIRWNMHKSYMLGLATRGVPIVPTCLLLRGSDQTLDRVSAGRGWDDVVIKPAVGATARLTVHVGRIGHEQAETHLQDVLAREDVLIQPYLPAVVTEGELSVVAIAGELTHAVVKRPRHGDWRVQSEFGGSSERVPLDQTLRAAAHTVLAALDTVPLYARIDLVSDGRQSRLIELELIEPELFFRFAPESADAMADLLLS